MKSQKNNTPKSSSRQTIDLSPDELLFLVRKHSLQISNNSPLYHLNITSTMLNLKNIEDKGLLDKKSDWHDVLVAICNPDFQATSILSGPGEVISAAYYTNRDNSNLIVGCWPKDEFIHISFPWEPSDIVANDFAALGLNSAPNPDFKKMHFSPDGFMSFAAAVDAIRMVLLTSVLHRKLVSDLRFHMDQLDLMLRLSLEDKSVDSRWLVTLLFMFTPDTYIPPDKAINQKGVKELVDLGLITIEDEDYWRPTIELINISSNWMSPLPAIYHETVITHPDKSTDSICSLTLCGSGPVCLVEFNNSEEKRPDICLRQLEVSTYWLELTGMVTPPKADKKQEPKQKPNETIHTEESQAESIYRCPSCNAIVKKGQKFCTSCGNKIPENLEAVVEETSSVKKCPKCGAELPPGAKFCTSCGAKV